MKNIIFAILPVIFLVIFNSCASSSCRNDACYNRRIASIDPYKDGEIAAWGSEKQAAEEEEKNTPARERFMFRER